jgi:hypothetical protein
MATGFPTKANWAAGDVLTAAQMDDLAGTVNLFSNASATTGSQLISNAAGTSFAYSPTPSASNPVLNSAFQVWQRGTSFGSGAQYTADRWYKDGQTYSTISRQTTNDTTNLPFIQYCARIQRNSGQTGTAECGVTNSFETINAIPFAGKQVTVSFYARAGANFSASSSNMTYYLFSGTGTDQRRDFTTAYTGEATVSTGTKTLTTSWQRFSFTGTVAATATELSLMFYFLGVGTAGANDYFEVTGVQIDVGSVALPFRTNGGTFQGELAACQRYLPAISFANNGELFSGLCYSTTKALIPVVFPVTARVQPTGITVNSAGNFSVRSATASLLTLTGLVFSTGTYYGSTIDATVASGLVAGNATNLFNGGSGTILFTGCEL